MEVLQMPEVDSDGIVPTAYAKVATHFLVNQASVLEKFHIGYELKDKVVFREELQVCLEGSEAETGRVKINISRTGLHDEFYLVRASANATLDGSLCKAKTVSIVDRDFRTIQELRTEFGGKSESGFVVPADQSMFISLEKAGYRRTVTDKNTDPARTVDMIPHKYTKHLIGEGANLLLLRYLALTQYEGTFDAVTMLMGGKLCVTTYNCSAPKDVVMNGQGLQVMDVKRNIHICSDVEEQMTTMLAKTGQQLEHCWENWPYALRIRSGQAAERHIKDNLVNFTLHLCWDEDMVLVSKYHDKLVREKASYTSYMLDHPELRDLISDYVQAFLLQEPELVIPFSVNYFTAFQCHEEMEESDESLMSTSLVDNMSNEDFEHRDEPFELKEFAGDSEHTEESKEQSGQELPEAS